MALRVREQTLLNVVLYVAAGLIGVLLTVHIFPMWWLLGGYFSVLAMYIMIHGVHRRYDENNEAYLVFDL